VPLEVEATVVNRGLRLQATWYLKFIPWLRLLQKVDKLGSGRQSASDILLLLVQNHVWTKRSLHGWHLSSSFHRFPQPLRTTNISIICVSVYRLWQNISYQEWRQRYSCLRCPKKHSTPLEVYTQITATSFLGRGSSIFHASCKTCYLLTSQWDKITETRHQITPKYRTS
jgi:hypothetical protein